MGKILGLMGFLISILGIIAMIFIPGIGLLLGIISFMLCLTQFIKEKSMSAIAGLFLSIIVIIGSALYLSAPLVVSGIVENTLASNKNQVENMSSNLGKV